MPRIDAEADPATGPSEELEWKELHEQVEKLPPDLLAVFDLIYYHGLSQQEAANVLGISERMVRRRWREARLRIQEWAK